MERYAGDGTSERGNLTNLDDLIAKTHWKQPLRFPNFPLPSFLQTTSLAGIRTLVPLAALLTHLIMSPGSRETEIDGVSLGMHRVCQRRRAQRAGQKSGKGLHGLCPRHVAISQYYSPRSTSCECAGGEYS